VQHPAHAVGGLASQRRRPGVVTIEGRAPVEQLTDIARTVLYEHVDGLGAAEPVARLHRVAGVELRRVVGANRRGDAALRVAGVALARIGLGEHQHVAHLGERDRGTKAGDAAADDEEVGGHSHGAILSITTRPCRTTSRIAVLVGGGATRARPNR